MTEKVVTASMDEAMTFSRLSMASALMSMGSGQGRNAASVAAMAAKKPSTA